MTGNASSVLWLINALYRDSRLEYRSLPDALHGSYEWVLPRLSLRLSVIAPTNTSSGYFYLARSGDFYLASISVIYLNIHYAKYGNNDDAWREVA